MPVHVPSSAVSVSPSRVVPLIDGSPVFDGAAAPIVGVGSEPASAEPAAFVAVTSTRIVPPTSSEVTS